MRPFGTMQKADVSSHSKNRSHEQALEILAKRKDMDCQWEKLVMTNKVQKLQKLQGSANRVRASLFLAQQELAVTKFPSLLEYSHAAGVNNCDPKGPHSSVTSSWGFIEATDVVLLQKDSELLRSALMHSIIVDATTDCEEWFVVMVRLLKPNGRVRLMFWELLHVPDEVSETLTTAVLGLYNLGDGGAWRWRCRGEHVCCALFCP